MRAFTDNRHHSTILGIVLTVLAVLGCLPVTSIAQTAVHYRLGTGDVIEIQVFGEPDLSMQVRVDESGRMVYPFLGNITLAGATINEIRDLITSGLQGDYLINPEVSVSMVKYRNFFVNGEVKSPGSYPYAPGLNVFQAISLAGGFSERASKSKIFLIPEENQSIRQRVELDSPIGPGDTLTVEQSFF